MNEEVELTHEFVEFVPEQLKERTLYISIRYRTSSHLCVCGCKNKVDLPIHPTKWTLIFDGKSISLHPSIGNWNFPCRSHYWIRNNKARSSEQWSTRQIEAGRTATLLQEQLYFHGKDEAETPDIKEEVAPSVLPVKKRPWWRAWLPW